MKILEHIHIFFTNRSYIQKLEYITRGISILLGSRGGYRAIEYTSIHTCTQEYIYISGCIINRFTNKCTDFTIAN